MINPDMLNRIARAVTFGKTREEIRAFGEDAFIEGHAGERLNGKIGEMFDSHGIAKGTFEEQLKSLNTLLLFGPSKAKVFHTAPWSLSEEKRAAMGAAMGTSGGTSYKHGSFVVVSKIGQRLTRKDDIGFVAVNIPFYKQIPLLQQAFPHIKFVKMNEMPKALTAAYDSALRQQAMMKNQRL